MTTWIFGRYGDTGLVAARKTMRQGQMRTLASAPIERTTRSHVCRAHFHVTTLALSGKNNACAGRA